MRRRRGAEPHKGATAAARAAALLNSAGRRCDNCGQELECCAFWPLTAGAGTADAPGGRRLLCCINCARAEGWWRVGEARSIQRREVCSFFAEGSCGEGGRCRFVHQDPNAARLAAPRAAGAPTSYPRSGESYISVLDVRVLYPGDPNLVGLSGDGNRGRPRVQHMCADMALNGVLRFYDELDLGGGVPVEGSLGAKQILDDALAKCAPGGTITLEVYRDDDYAAATLIFRCQRGAGRRGDRRRAAAAGAAADGDESGGGGGGGRRRGRCSTRRCKKALPPENGDDGGLSEADGLPSMPPPPPARWLSPAPPAAAPPPDAEWPTLGSTPAPPAAPPAAGPLEIPAEEIDLAQMLVEAGVPLIEIAEQPLRRGPRKRRSRSCQGPRTRAARRRHAAACADADAGAALSAPLAQLKLQLIEQLNAAPLGSPPSRRRRRSRRCPRAAAGGGDVRSADASAPAGGHRT